MAGKWLLCSAALLAGLPLSASAQDQRYRVVVVSESGDIVTWLKPNGGSLTVDRVVPVGIMPADIDGPHNVALVPDGKSYLVTIAHGVPFGTLWRFDLATDSVMGKATVELFPTTISVTPDGEFAFVANSDFHGDRPRINPVSIESREVATEGLWTGSVNLEPTTQERRKSILDVVE